jgi:hypothetical protein
MEKLTAPSRDMALQLLDEVNFQDRLIGSILHTRAGVRIVSLYSLEEVFLLLKEPYPQIDLAQLEHWIRTIIHDGELADRIKSVIQQEAGNQDTVHTIRDLVGWRLIQCKQVTG